MRTTVELAAELMAEEYLAKRGWKRVVCPKCNGSGTELVGAQCVNGECVVPICCANCNGLRSYWQDERGNKRV